MNDEFLSCPECRARVFQKWHECKFCGASLRSDAIGAAMDPDELVSPSSTAASEGTSSALPEADDAGPTQPTSAWDPASETPNWDAPFGPDPGSGTTAGGSFGDGWGDDAPDPSMPVPPGDPHDAWAMDPTASDGGAPDPGEGAGSLVPVGDADVTWAPGPAPAVDDDGPRSDPYDPDAFGTTGLDPVAWYTEPGSSTDSGGSEEAGPGGSTPGAWSAGFSTEDGVTGTGGVDTADSPDPPGFDGEVFDREAIFQGPDPGDDDALGRDLEPSAAPGEVAINWEPAAADAWDSPVEPKGKPKGQAVLSRESRLLLMGIILILVVAGGALWLLDRDEGHPQVWAPNVETVADWVAKTRDVPFEHKVAVQTLAPNAYDAAVEQAARPDNDDLRRRLDDQVAMWRALGAVQGDPKARISVIDAQRPELGAFYDLATKTLNVRAGAEVAGLRVGIAGALSVALDDQRADLSSLQKPSVAEDPLFDVVTGTAALMRSKYRDGQAGDPDPQITGLPDMADAESLGFLTARPILQTRLGEGLASLVEDVNGRDAANELAPHPPSSSRQVMLPLAFFAGQSPLVVAEPTVPEDAEKLEEGTLGVQSWYLLLAAHAPDDAALGAALDFVDTWAGDHYVAFRKANGQVCVTDVLRGADESAAQALTVTLNAWSDAVPGDRIEVRAEGDTDIVVTGCDAGATADQALEHSMALAVSRAVIRSQLAARYYFAGTKIPNGINGPIFDPDVAWCMGDNAVRRADPAQLVALATRSGPVYKSLTLAAAGHCGSNLADQLFADVGS